MHVRHDELYLLSSRTGRYVSERGQRSGPPRPTPPPRPPTRPPSRGSGHRGLVAQAVSGCRRALHRGGEHEHGVSAPGRTRPNAYARRDTYVELEFAVGFGAEDEQWL